VKLLGMGLDIFSGIREPDEFHKDHWAAVGIDMNGKGPTHVTEATAAAEFGIEMIIKAAEHPESIFAPEILDLPQNGGVTAKSVTSLGLQMIFSGIKAMHELAIYQVLAEMGWTDKDKDRLLSEVSEKMRDSNPVARL
jgi:hypothetical protein